MNIPAGQLTHPDRNYEDEYVCRCHVCNLGFVGHKRQSVCRQCASKEAENEKTASTIPTPRSEAVFELDLDKQMDGFIRTCRQLETELHQAKQQNEWNIKQVKAIHESLAMYKAEATLAIGRLVDEKREAKQKLSLLISDQCAEDERCNKIAERFGIEADNTKKRDISIATSDLMQAMAEKLSESLAREAALREALQFYGDGQHIGVETTDGSGDMWISGGEDGKRAILALRSTMPPPCIPLTEVKALVEALETCKDHNYSDGMRHHQSFDSDAVKSALSVFQFNHPELQ